jgi:endonuclease III
MQKKERFLLFIDHFTENFPEPETELEYIDPFQLLIAVILSAQCTDKRINMVTPRLFREYPSPAMLAVAKPEEVYSLIKSVTYPNNKAKHLINMAGMLVDQFDSRVPERVEDLRKLPGVGRKTAHVIASVIYNQPVMAVDTHVFRVSKRLGLADHKATTPLAVEKQLVAHIPEKYLSKAHHWLILHGRYVCTARSPRCRECGLSHLCKYFQQNIKI